jgi:hypothetical protein
MGFMGYIARILFVILVAVAFNYRTQIVDVFNRTIYNSPTPPPKPEQQTPSKPREPIKPPDSDYYNPPFDPSNPSDPIIAKSGTRMITANELAAHGHSGPLKPIWLAMLGMVFDVDKGAEHYYGPEGGYNFFTGIILCMCSVQGLGRPWPTGRLG